MNILSDFLYFFLSEQIYLRFSSLQQSFYIFLMGDQHKGTDTDRIQQDGFDR